MLEPKDCSVGTEDWSGDGTRPMRGVGTGATSDVGTRVGVGVEAGTKADDQNSQGPTTKQTSGLK